MPTRIRAPLPVAVLVLGVGLRLEHDHRPEDGSPEVLKMYGGDTTGSGTAARQEFPADA